MKQQASAFLIRSLRQESRFVSHHLMRAGLAALVLLLFFGRLATFSMRAGVGATFASDVMTSCYWFVTLLGGIYFSTAIVEEKEEQTLPLLKMTGASPVAILLGKSGPRLVSVLLLLLLVTPFLLLAITLGGVLPRGLLSATLGILTYSVMFCQLGLLASVVSRDFPRAFSKTIVAWLMLEFLPFWSWIGSVSALYLSDFGNAAAAESYLRTAGSGTYEWSQYTLAWLHGNLQWFGGWTDDLVLCGNLNMYMAEFGNTGVWEPQMTAHLILAVVFFGLSWLLFEPCTARVVAEGHDSPGRLSRRVRQPRRAGNKALAWKSWRHSAGGWLWFFIRLIGAPVFVCCIVLGVALAVDESVSPWVLAGTLIISGVVIFVGSGAILLDRVFNTEVRDKTLGSLLMLPVSRNSLCGRLILGLLPSIAASTSCSVCGLILLGALEGLDVEAVGDVLKSAWFYQVILMGVTTVWFGLYLSLRLRYGGMLLAIICVWMIAPTVIGSFLAISSFGFRRQAVQSFTTAGLPIILMIAEIVFCWWMHKLTIQRLDSVAEQE
ncbi:MAG: hypothetical protein P8J37_04295 [Fuerstiella sp.]|nr:hypothetical protein [Fuerstiella sp.]